MPRRLCAHPGCNRPARFLLKIGKKRVFKADDDHELCQEHYRALNQAEQARELPPTEMPEEES